MVFRTVFEDNSWLIYPGGRDHTSVRNVGPQMSEETTVSINSLASGEGILVTVEPPKIPENSDLSHVPCDIVLVIDVSWSMTSAAPVVGLDQAGAMTKEHAGFSVLDITKHAALTVLETLESRDRLGIVTFSTNAKIVQALLPMNAYNKRNAAKQIRALKEESSTNLWQGILQGCRLFEDNKNSGRVPAVLVLTDGQPNHQNPVLGYVSALRSMSPLPATIHTFGFGNDIKSGLLKSIAEVGGGSYSFIPDAGMVGTVFVNAVAHLQSTFANRCTLKLTVPEKLCLRHNLIQSAEYQKEGVADTLQIPRALPQDGHPWKSFTINLGNLQYGQSRDIYFSSDTPNWLSKGPEKPKITAELRFSRMYGTQFVVKAEQNALLATLLPDSKIAYHQSRAMICDFLSSFFPVLSDGEHDMPRVNPATNSRARETFEDLVAKVPARNYDDVYNRSLMQDLLGQVKLAIFESAYRSTWGPHYFLSLWDAHARQARNTFKDPGVQIYDMNSPLFLKCQKDLIYAFDTAVEPPEPSLKAYADEKYSSGRVAISMSSFNDSDYPCFSASSLVTLGDGSRIPVSRLRKGTSVLTPAGSGHIAAVLKTRVKNIILLKIQDLLVTPWHPLKYRGAWTFPARVAKEASRYSGAVYSILLEPCSDPEANAIQVGGVWAVTMGHGILKGQDARAHSFLGNHMKVSRALSLVGIRSDGVVVAAGVKRGERSGRLNGFKGAAQSCQITHVNQQG